MDMSTTNPRNSGRKPKFSVPCEYVTLKRAVPTHLVKEYKSRVNEILDGYLMEEKTK